MEKFDNDCELLLIDMPRPAALATHDEIIAVAIVFDTALERHGCALNRPLLPCLRTRDEIAIVSRSKLRKPPVLLFALAIMIKDQIRLASADQPEAHADAGIIGPRMAHRRIERQRHADAALDVSRLERFRDRNPIHGKMIEREFVFPVVASDLGFQWGELSCCCGVSGVLRVDFTLTISIWG